MTTEQIRLAIAKSLGWDEVWVDRPNKCHRGLQAPNMPWVELPDWTQDLNAIHEAVATMTDEEWKGYNRILDLMLCKPRKFYESTALQRSIAYLKCKSLWVETKEVE